jgi:quercetin dioxygenase-like cupin family protein
VHQHPHEQVSYVLEGEFELTVNGVPHRLVPGQVFVIPSNMPHAGLAITDCFILDVFTPVREDYREKGGVVLG